MEDRQHYTFSKIGCWLALSNAAELARNGHIAGNAERWEKESERIRGWIDEHCWSEAKQCYKFHAGTERLRKRKAPLSHAPAGSSKPMRFSERSIGRGEMLQTLLAKLGNNFGILNEQIDPHTGAGLGNLPQGFSHLALLHAIFSIQEKR
ncbi:hypothetical protein HJB56_28660 [Rhizobium lentis]|uniref:hypothetical protein n=1 Tax=Rhizobium lentis TaxID=1138194 RepID=UPI001C83AD8F|nr:hypothetical protein [Rhizobium lentis]MBX5086700.1 hypothetical protein [Rhizobium lentis]MBX5099345.1 hypothetical protein [Rhizobium lentis]MBX5124145.1 hypothetical protein [Rhizobium lentis]MBX5130402.1 hypothetical protein [Rhizobium lentis]